MVYFKSKSNFCFSVVLLIVCCKENASMISRVNLSSLNFKANDYSSVRDAYKAELDENSKIAQGQNGISASNVGSQIKNQIPMQGGQKLDVIA